MAASEIRHTQVTSTDIVVEKLPDGSTAVLDQRSKDIHSLNSSATAVWEACKRGATLADVRKALEAHMGTTVDEELARSALSQLSKVSLIHSDAPVPASAADTARRRAMLVRMGMVAVPLVLTLAFAEQKALAFQACSNNACQ
jgi:hypothetical protein